MTRPAERIKHRDIIQRVSLPVIEDQVRSSTGYKDVKVDPISLPDAVLSHHMAIIVLSGRSMKATIKIHYTIDAAKNLIEEKFKTIMKDPTAEVSQKYVHDFMKETANLIAGGVKAAIGDLNILKHLSTPLQARGFDEVVFLDSYRTNFPETERAVWKVEQNKKSIFVSLESHILDLSMFPDEAAEKKKSGALTFL